MRSGKAMFSNTVMCGNRARLWNTIPRLRSRGSHSVTRSSPMYTSPAVGDSRPAMMLSVVVLPQPDGPTKTTNSPSVTSRLTPLTASVAPKRLTIRSSLTPAIPYSPSPRRGLTGGSSRS